MSKSVTKLLAAFNDNPKNSELVDYITRTNYFDVIGKSRNEMVHSRMLSEIIAGRYFEVSRGTTLLHFFDIIMKRAAEQGVDVPDEFRDAVLTRSKLLDFTIEKKEVELSLSDYLGGKNSYTSDKQKRLDVYLQLTIPKPIKGSGRKTIEIFLENKVLSSEHDNQTQVYYNECSNRRGKGTYKFFVYLSPLSSREIKDYNNLDDSVKPSAKKGKRPVYTHICYQDILDTVIEPLSADKRLNNRDLMLLEDYANCLELVSMPNDGDNNGSKPSPKELSIMAISAYEKELIDGFINNEDNKQLFDLVVAQLLNKKLYSFDSSTNLTFNQLMKETITKCIDQDGVLETINSFDSIISRQGGGVPFIVYGKVDANKTIKYIDPKYLYEYNNIVYMSLSNALARAIVDYSNVENVIENLENSVIGHQKGSKGLLTDSQQDDYEKIDGLENVFIKQGIGDEKLEIINKCFGKMVIQKITNRSFCDLLNYNEFFAVCNKGVINVPNTNVFFREDVEKKHNKIIEKMRQKGLVVQEQKLNDDEKALLAQFFNNNRNLVISIYRIMLEKETDPIVYNEMTGNFKKIISRANKISN